MVDKDRLNELTGGGSNDNKSKKSGGKRKSKKKKKKSSSNKERTKKDKLSAFKGSSSSPPDQTSGDTEDIKRLLFTLSNMEVFTRILKDYEAEGMNPAQMRVKEEFSADVSNEITNFLGVFGVQDIIDDYGYDWSHILDLTANKRDMTGKSLKTNSGNVKKEDVKELLDCIANVILFVEGNIRAKEEKDDDKMDMRDKTIKFVAEKMYEQYKDIISKNRVQRISERHGYDWQKDVLQDVLENQDFGSKIKQ